MKIQNAVLQGWNVTFPQVQTALFLGWMDERIHVSNGEKHILSRSDSESNIFEIDRRTIRWEEEEVRELRRWLKFLSLGKYSSIWGVAESAANWHGLLFWENICHCFGICSNGKNQLFGRTLTGWLDEAWITYVWCVYKTISFMCFLVLLISLHVYNPLISRDF